MIGMIKFLLLANLLISYSNSLPVEIEVEVTPTPEIQIKLVEEEDNESAKEAYVKENERRMLILSRRYPGASPEQLAALLAGEFRQPRRKSSSYGKRKRRQTHDGQKIHTSTFQEVPLENAPVSEFHAQRLPGVDLTKFLQVAGAKPQAVDPSGSYTRRKRQGKPIHQSQQQTETEFLAPTTTNFHAQRLPGVDLSKFLQIAGAKPQAVDPSGSYTRRKRQEGKPIHQSQQQTQTEFLAPTTTNFHAQRLPGVDLSKFLQIAGAKPQAVDPSGSYTRRKRQGKPIHQSQQQTETEFLAPTNTNFHAQRLPGVDLSKFLQIAGAKPQAVDPSGSYTRKRSPQFEPSHSEPIRTNPYPNPAPSFHTDPDIPLSDRVISDYHRKRLSGVNLDKFLAVAGAKPTPVELDASYTR